VGSYLGGPSGCYKPPGGAGEGGTSSGPLVHMSHKCIHKAICADQGLNPGVHLESMLNTACALRAWLISKHN